MIFALLLVPVLAYLILSLWAIRVLYKSSSNEQADDTPHNVSIIVPMRNESHNIVTLLNSVYEQCANCKNCEMILIDDASTDDTLAKVKLWQRHHPAFNLIILSTSPEKFGKKAAIHIGIVHAQYDNVITIDADCIATRTWLNDMYRGNKHMNATLLCGPVLVHHDLYWWKWQSAENTHLQAFTAATIIGGKPVMCNGANLMYRKSKYQEIEEAEMQPQMAGGDDVFLLHAFKKRGYTICYQLSRASIVYTLPASTFLQGIHQRVRWASKGGAINDSQTAGFGIIIGFTQLVLCCAIIWVALFDGSAYLLAAMYTGKIFVDVACSAMYLSKLKHGYSVLTHTVIYSLLSPLYFVGIYILSIFTKVKWKERYYL